jgi:hypothetical protein
MHYRFFVIFDKDKAENSEEARRLTTEMMEAQANEQFYDWFVIGGRWSGEFSQIRMPKKTIEHFRATFEKVFGWFTSSNISEGQRRQQAEWLEKIYGLLAGTFFRDTYNEVGEYDDAQILDDVLYKMLQDEGYTGEGSWGDNEFVIVEGEKLCKKHIGMKWIVVVDYHN